VTISPQTRNWLRQSAALDGAVVSQTLLNLLERVEALEQQPTCKQSLQVPPTPDAAPVATDEDLLAMRSWSSHGPTFDSDLVEFGRACCDLGRQHGAAQPPVAPPRPIEVGPHRIAGTADDPLQRSQPAPPPAPAGGLVERVEAVIRPSIPGDPNVYRYEARAAIREVAAWMRENETGYNAVRLLEQEASR